MEDIVTIAILSPLLLLVVAIAISKIIGAIHEVFLRNKEFTPEEKSRLMAEQNEKNKLHQKELDEVKQELSNAKIENAKEIANMRFSCNRSIEKAKQDAEKRVSEYASTARRKENQLDHQIFTLKAENQALTKEVKQVKAELEKERSAATKNIERQYASYTNDLYAREQAEAEAKKNKTTAYNLRFWHEMTLDMVEAARGDLPKAFIDDKMIDAYIESMKTSSLPKALREEMKIESPISVSAKIHSANSDDVYITTLTSCTCLANRKPCKHMIALALKIKALTPHDLKLRYEIMQFGKQVHYDVAAKKQANDDRKKAGQYKNDAKKLEAVVNNIIAEKKQYYPWFADFLARYEIAKMQITVKDPKDKRKLVQEITKCKRENEKLHNQLLVYEKTIPFLAESNELSPDEFIEKAKCLEKKK